VDVSTESAELAEVRARVAQLQTALDSRIVVEQAKGVLAERFGLGIDEAFLLLRYSARSSRTNLHELAQAVVASRATPRPVAGAVERPERWRPAAAAKRSST
jgi:AmiR/NasT family two-component response regulator